MKKLSKMEQRLLNVMGGEYVGSAILMDRLYAGLRRPKTSTISPMIRRLRAKGVQIESVRGKGYRMVRGQVSKALSLDTTYGSVKLAPSLRQGGTVSQEIRGMFARYGLNFSVVADMAMKAIRAIATPAPAYLLTAPPKYGAVDFVRNAEGVYQAE